MVTCSDMWPRRICGLRSLRRRRGGGGRRPFFTYSRGITKTDVFSSGTGTSQLQRRLTTSCSLRPVFTLDRRFWPGGHRVRKTTAVLLLPIVDTEDVFLDGAASGSVALCPTTVDPSRRARAVRIGSGCWRIWGLRRDQRGWDVDELFEMIPRQLSPQCGDFLAGHSRGFLALGFPNHLGSLFI